MDKTLKIAIIAVAALYMQGCGLSVSSDSSCKSSLCKGYWRDFGGWGQHVKLTFNNNGTFNYNKVSMSNNPADTPGGLPLGSYDGVWSLGVAKEESNFKLEDGDASSSSVMTRHINMTFNQNTSKGKSFDVQLTISPKTKYVVLYGLPDSDQIAQYSGENPVTE